METKNQKERTCKFLSIHEGAVFLDGENAYMKIVTIIPEEGMPINAINLYDGLPVYFAQESQIIPRIMSYMEIVK